MAEFWRAGVRLGRLGEVGDAGGVTVMLGADGRVSVGFKGVGLGGIEVGLTTGRVEVAVIG